jgi:GNAT superfamily N-acetyltransferase
MDIRALRPDDDRDAFRSGDSDLDAFFRIAALSEILPLRHAVLRPGRPEAEAHFDGDGEPETIHAGAFEDGTAVACASLMSRPFDGAPAWQLRGMATSPDRQRRGLGRRLLAFLENRLHAASAVRLLWCNARVGAAPFYERMGWETVSGVFTIEGVGPHVRMRRRLPPH